MSAAPLGLGRCGHDWQGPSPERAAVAVLRHRGECRRNLLGPKIPASARPALARSGTAPVVGGGRPKLVSGPAGARGDAGIPDPAHSLWRSMGSNSLNCWPRRLALLLLLPALSGCEAMTRMNYLD